MVLGKPWAEGLSRILGLVDATAIAAAMLLAHLVSFGTRMDYPVAGAEGVQYWMLTVGISVVWWWLLRQMGSTSESVLGAGVEEYRRVASSSLALFGGIAITSYALYVETGRRYVALALPLGLLLLLVGRRLVRTYVSRKRRSGSFMKRLVLVGSPSAVEHLHRTLAAAPESGYLAAAAVLPGYQLRSPTGQELAVEVLSVSQDVDEIVDVAERVHADGIAVTSGSILKPKAIQQLGWELRDRGISMILAPTLTDIAGPRIHTQPVAGLPLIHVSTPSLEGGRGLIKRFFDVVGAVLLLVLIIPFLLIVALLVKLDSPGPVFFHQQRIGKDGAPFTMHKFRSMVPGAEQQLTALMGQHGGATAFFKVKDDPRLTRFGAFIRKYSIDELPQLWNVLAGDMSMVGPRPQVRAEVDTYRKHDHRRLLVRPGITGLWQVSGRSDLSVEDSVRLDLYYVENWSLMQDLVILVRTVRAVFTKYGAY